MDTVTIDLVTRGESKRYTLPYKPGTSALWALRYIYEQYDHSIALPTCLCRMGKCGCCAMKVDGKAVLGCAAMLEPGTHDIQWD